MCVNNNSTSSNKNKVTIQNKKIKNYLFLEVEEKKTTEKMWNCLYTKLKKFKKKNETEKINCLKIYI